MQTNLRAELRATLIRILYAAIPERIHEAAGRLYLDGFDVTADALDLDFEIAYAHEVGIEAATGSYVERVLMLVESGPWVIDTSAQARA